MQNFFKVSGKYVVSALLLVLGSTFLYKYASAGEIDSQPVDMLFGALFLLFAGIISLPFVMSRLPLALTRILLIVCIIGAGYLAYRNIFVIQEEIDFRAKKDQIESKTIQRMKDIRTAQEEFEKNYGIYTDNFDTLISFIKNPIIPIVYRNGDVSANDSLMDLDKRERLKYIIGMSKLEEMGMTEEEAVAKGYEVRDTTYASLYEKQFAQGPRSEKGLPPVSLDSLPYSPASGEKFIMRTDKIMDGGVERSTILVKDPKPYGKPGTEKIPKDTLMFGDLDEANTSGNWGSR